MDMGVSCSLNACYSCNLCELAKTRKKVVLFRGDPSARVMLIGEAPGAAEDLVGEPFVGRSGKKLDNLLKRVGLNIHEDLYICNAIKCRPPKNRRPTKSEIKACRPWLEKQIALVDPLVIILAGTTAVETILGLKDGISTLRGNWQRWEGRWVMPLFHPSYLLRNPSSAEGSPSSLTFNDLIEVKKMINGSLKFHQNLDNEFLKL